MRGGKINCNPPSPQKNNIQQKQILKWKSKQIHIVTLSVFLSLLVDANAGGFVSEIFRRKKMEAQHLSCYGKYIRSWAPALEKKAGQNKCFWTFLNILVWR